MSTMQQLLDLSTGTAGTLTDPDGATIGFYREDFDGNQIVWITDVLCADAEELSDAVEMDGHDMVAVGPDGAEVKLACLDSRIPDDDDDDDDDDLCEAWEAEVNALPVGALLVDLHGAADGSPVAYRTPDGWLTAGSCSSSLHAEDAERVDGWVVQVRRLGHVRLDRSSGQDREAVQPCLSPTEPVPRMAVTMDDVVRAVHESLAEYHRRAGVMAEHDNSMLARPGRGKTVALRHVEPQAAPAGDAETPSHVVLVDEWVDLTPTPESGARMQELLRLGRTPVEPRLQNPTISMRHDVTHAFERNTEESR